MEGESLIKSGEKKEGYPYPTPAWTSSIGKRPLPSFSDSEAAAAEELLEQLVPTEDIMRIMRNCLPAHAKISGEAKEAVQESVLGFISAVTSIAGEHCRQQRRQVVTSEDMLVALKRLCFNGYSGAR
ncbi:Nuclear transcription factor Y subunit B-9 [Nymphaea thermarum]|nr:Nuclear transcription factor Y subunit B-9 [Nymphaea thermarum]